MSSEIYAVMAPAAVVRVSGEDAARFLQGQFSNDVRNCAGRAVYGLWLDPRAKICGDGFVLLNHDDSYLLVSYYYPAHELIEKLDRFIIADDVVLENLTGEFQLLLCTEPVCVEVWGEPGPPLDTDPAQLRHAQLGLAWFGRHGIDHLIDWLLPNDAVASVREALETAGAVCRSLHSLQLHRIRNRVPMIPVDIGPEETPADAGLLGTAVSLNKGCYIGQEVVAKQNLTDRSAKAMVLLQGRPELKEFPVDLMDAEGRSVGAIRSAAREGEVTWALGVVKRKTVVQGAGFFLQAPAETDAPADFTVVMD